MTNKTKMYIFFINISQKIKRLVIDNRIFLGFPRLEFLSTPLAYCSMRFLENGGCKVFVCKFSWPTSAVYSRYLNKTNNIFDNKNLWKWTWAHSAV